MQRSVLKQGHPLHRGRQRYSSLFLDVKVVIKVSEILIGSFVSYKPLCLWSCDEQEYSSSFIPRISHQKHGSHTETYNFEFVFVFFWSNKNHICTSPNEISPISVKRQGVANPEKGRGGGWGGGVRGTKNELLKSWSGYLASEWYHHHLHHHHHTNPSLLREWRGKIIGFFPTNNTFTPELN